MPPANELLLIFMTLPLHDIYSNWSLLEIARECLNVLYERGETSISVVRDDYGGSTLASARRWLTSCVSYVLGFRSFEMAWEISASPLKRGQQRAGWY